MLEVNSTIITENSLINWSDSDLNNVNSGGISNDSSGSYSYTIPVIFDYYHNHHYPTFYPTVQIEESKVDKAFKILKILQEKKIINITKVKTFIELVDEIMKTL